MHPAERLKLLAESRAAKQRNKTTKEAARAFILSIFSLRNFPV
jgi:hypothetical protein